MEFILKESDLITLENDNQYLVVKLFEYESNKYAYLIKLTDYDEKNPEILFVQEIVEGKDLLVEPVDDEPLCNKLLAVVKDLYK